MKRKSFAPSPRALLRVRGAIRDGKTGERHYWIRWQKKIFEDNPGLEFAGQKEGWRKDTPLPYYRLRSGVAPRDLSFSGLGYADAAINSYKTFARLQNEGVIPRRRRLPS